MMSKEADQWEENKTVLREIVTAVEFRQSKAYLCEATVMIRLTLPMKTYTEETLLLPFNS